jgi:choline dehydrogenase
MSRSNAVKPDFSSEVPSFDYVIVGAGAAGALLAARLSEDPKVSVCVLESGRPDTSPWLRIPAGFIKVIGNPKWTWQFSAEPTERTAGRRIALPQGRTLGGTMSINGMIYNRGQAEDYDEWAAQGCPGWSYADVLPYFRRTERWLGKPDAHFHGDAGPVAVSGPSWRHPLCDAFIEGAARHDLPHNPDYNGRQQSGAGYFQRTIAGRWRTNTARGLLHPASGRPNLTVLTRAHCASLMFADGDASSNGQRVPRVTGVRYLEGKQQTMREVHAKREVVLCAGALNTPKLLELSGIGAPHRIAALGVTLRHAAPGVGENLGDHYSVRVVASVKGVKTINELSRGRHLVTQLLNWLFDRPSMLAVSPSMVHWFARSGEAAQRPDLQGVFTPASYREGRIGMLDAFPGMTAGVWAHRPKSRGSVHAVSADPMAAPRIEANYLSDPGDRAVLVAGIRKARALLRSSALAPYFEREVLPGPTVRDDDDEALLAFASRYGSSAQHLVGTAKMGPSTDPMAVVDPWLRVHGVGGLRIADASVIPATPSANSCAATMMVAERAADLLRGRIATSATAASAVAPSA